MTAEIIQFIPKAKPEPTLLEGAEIKAAEFLALIGQIRARKCWAHL